MSHEVRLRYAPFDIPNKPERRRIKAGEAAKRGQIIVG